MEPLIISSIIFIAIAYWGSAFLVWRKCGLNDRLSPGLVRLGIFSGSWAVCSAVLWVNGLNGVENDLHRFLSLSGIVFFSILIMHYSQNFLMAKTSKYNWTGVGVVLWIIILFFSGGLLGFSEFISLGGWLIPRFLLAGLAALAGVAFFTARTIQLTAIAFRSASQPSHKNRLLYWTLALGIFGLVYLFVLFNQELIGGLLSLGGFLVLIYIVVAGNLIDLIRMGAQSLRFMVVTLLTVGVYAAGFLVAEVILSEMRVAQPALTALLIAAVFVLVLNPFVTWVAQKINNLVFGQGYNPSVIVRGYSQSIGNVVDLRLLKQVSLGLIYKVIGIKSGNLYLVDEVKEDDASFYRISPIRSGDSTDEAVIQGRLSATSPVALHFSKLKQPLLQYELDFSSVYEELLPADRELLLLQNAEAFIPILTRAGWIGLSWEQNSRAKNMERMTCSCWAH